MIKRIGKKIYAYFLGLTAKMSKEPVLLKNRHDSYDSYVAKQKEKTLDKSRIEKWQNEEWELKLEGFRQLFKRNKDFIDDKKNAICLGSRTGQEVKALRELGLECIGIDLVAFPPYSVVGDIHDLKYENEIFDLVFTNIFDHSLYPTKFCSEMERICAIGGIIIINLQVGLTGDDYAENVIHDTSGIVSMFNTCELIVDRAITNSFDGMNRELVLVKK